MMRGLCSGRVVAYVLASADLPGTHQRCVGEIIPAIVVNDWRGLKRDDGYANLTGFPDGTNQGFPGCVTWLTSRVYSADRLPGTWHWPDGSPAALQAAQSPAPEPVKAVETAVCTEASGKSVSVSKDDGGESTDTVLEVPPARETQEFTPGDIGDMPPDLMPTDPREPESAVASGDVGVDEQTAEAKSSETDPEKNAASDLPL